ncbi:MAG: exopolyphosphatase [Thermoleophilia bacterium]
MAGGRLAAIVDIGSNTVRLFLCDGVHDGLPGGGRRMRIVGLRRGAAADGTLAEPALDRLEECLRDFGGALRRAGARRGVALGTSAVRDAPNRRRVAELVERHLGLALTVLSGEEEAELAFLGARLAALEAPEILVVDVGGGSTELVRGGRAGIVRAISLQLGAVRCTDAWDHGDPPTEDELSHLRVEVEIPLREAVPAVGSAPTMIGVAGTVTTIAAVRAGGYDPAVVHGMRLSRAAVSEVLEELALLPEAARMEVPGLEPERAPVILAGVAIVEAAMAAAGVEELMVSERDLLDGAALRGDRLMTEVAPHG